MPPAAATAARGFPEAAAAAAKAYGEIRDDAKGAEKTNVQNQAYRKH